MVAADAIGDKWTELAAKIWCFQFEATHYQHGAILTGPFEAFVQRCYSAFGRYRRRRREEACLRCGRLAQAVCRACGARVCDRCWRLSLETGAPAFLCIECFASDPPGRPGRPFGGAETFNAGVKILLIALVGLVGAGYWEGGWSGLWSVVGALLHPAMVLGLVPLAFLLGAIRSALLHVVRALVTGFGRPSA